MFQKSQKNIAKNEQTAGNTAVNRMLCGIQRANK
jgi:hypothetical protein